MSEQVLNAILQLLGLIAREDGVTAEEEQTVTRFLREEVSHQDHRNLPQCVSKIHNSGRMNRLIR